jgi:DNA modification methylase
MTLPENQIVQGDSVQILKAFPSTSVDLVVTDPPYLVNYRLRSKSQASRRDANLKFYTSPG